MSINRKRVLFDKAHDNKEYRKIFIKWLYPPYWDEGWTWNHGNMENHKWRSYRTWKYNRKTQWK